jgi:hypothetical protein
VVIPSSAVTIHPKGTPAPASAVEVQVSETSESDLSNDMTWRQMIGARIGVGVGRVVLAQGELDKLEGPKYAARRAELRRKAGEETRARERQAAAPSQDEAGGDPVRQRKKHSLRVS